MNQTGAAGAAMQPHRAGRFRKFALSFVGINSLVLLAGGLLDGWFSFRETRQIGWTTHPQGVAGR